MKKNSNSQQNCLDISSSPLLPTLSVALKDMSLRGLRSMLWKPKSLNLTNFQHGDMVYNATLEIKENVQMPSDKDQIQKPKQYYSPSSRHIF